MYYLLGREPAIHYAQIRPMRTIHYSERQVTNLLDHGGRITMDCSEAVTCLCKWAGLHDPNGFHFNSYGFTGSLLANLRHYYDPDAALVGALVVYGPGTGHHVSMVLEPGHDPLLWSHGREAGPVRVRLSDQRQQQPAPVTFLSIARL
jgi:hypothetical protein